ncbi:MAG: hypothetical protein JWP75_3865 [Frondihabitans sp.]|nr:hypothetical protein [Frondihabitans sp.]
MTDYPQWLDELLGSAAPEVLSQLADCVAAGHERARDAQDASRLRQRNPYGGTSWLAVYDEFASTLVQIAGARLFKPKNASYELVVINGTLIYPCRVLVAGGRLEEGTLKPTRLRRAISAVNQQGVGASMLDFADLALEDGELLDPTIAIPSSVASRVLLVPYESSPEAGLLAIGVGEGTVLFEGTIGWSRFHQLPLNLHSAGPQPVREVEPRFDSGALPEPPLMPRQREVENPEAHDEVDQNPLRAVENDIDE